MVTIIGTNDIHGGFEAKGSSGGFAWFSGYVTAVKNHIQKKYGKNGTVLLLDAGDAAQGTLISNYSEGIMAAELMHALNYTAGVPGNHAYDFGPKNWTIDQCQYKPTPCDPLETLKAFVSAAHFPVLGFNVEEKTNFGTKPLDFLLPYTLVDFMDRKIAIFGLDNAKTSSTTIAENVSNLQFSIDNNKLKQAVEDLYSSGKADLFILVMHEGDSSDKSNGMGYFLEKLPRRSSGEPLFDAAIAGHTHRLNDNISNDIPYIQSGANGEMFGIVQLLVEKNPVTNRIRVKRDQTRKQAGIKINSKPTEFLGEIVKIDDAVNKILNNARNSVDEIAKQKLTELKGPFTTEGGRISDSLLGNLYSDLMRSSAKTDIAMINSGDLRASLPMGTLLFEDFFNAVPKNLRRVTLNPLPLEAFKDIPILGPTPDLRSKLIEQFHKHSSLNPADFSQGRYINCAESKFSELPDCK